MQWRGKILTGIAGIFIGDLIGLPLGGLTGFIGGALIGHYFLDAPNERNDEESEYREYRQKQGRFIFYVMAMGAKLAKADGPVNKLERDHVGKLMHDPFRLNDKGRIGAIRIWNQAKESSETFERYAAAFNEVFGKDRNQLENMMEILFSIAAADGRLHPREEELLLRAAHTFRITRIQYDRIKQRFYNTAPPKQSPLSPLDPHYAILDAKPSDSLDTIKQKYRTLAMRWHPDKVSATGASADAMRHAKEKFQKIKEAYEQIMLVKQNPYKKL
jgi:DnaJ like chaperone protein